MFLETSGHSVRYIAGTKDRNLPDAEVLELAVSEKRLLVTNDKDFGDLIYLHHHQHTGVILFRLSADLETDDAYARRMAEITKLPKEVVENRFIVVTDEHLRIR